MPNWTPQMERLVTKLKLTKRALIGVVGVQGAGKSAAAEAFLRGFDAEIMAKLTGPVIDPLTGIASDGDMRFQSKNVRKSDPGSNHDVSNLNHGENDETASEQGENPTTGVLQQDRPCMGWPGERWMQLSLLKQQCMP